MSVNRELAALGVLTLLAACSKGTVPAAAHSGAKETGSSLPAAISVCDRRWLTSDDFRGILSAPITGSQALPGDAQSCEFITAAFPTISVSLRPGLGRTTIDAWTSGKMPLDSTPLRGVGDEAVWVESLREVIARKEALLCDIQVNAGSSDIASNPANTPKVVGALCNKVFAAYGS
jgi:hypothetical protein